MISADDMKIKKGLVPIFCSKCGCRIGWAEELGTDYLIKYCEDCARVIE